MSAEETFAYALTSQDITDLKQAIRYAEDLIEDNLANGGLDAERRREMRALGRRLGAIEAYLRGIPGTRPGVQAFLREDMDRAYASGREAGIRDARKVLDDMHYRVTEALYGLVKK